MKLSDAKKILSGEWVTAPCKYDLEVCKKNDWSEWHYVNLTKADVTFCLRQLALKVTREKEK